MNECSNSQIRLKDQLKMRMSGWRRMPRITIKRMREDNSQRQISIASIVSQNRTTEINLHFYSESQNRNYQMAGRDLEHKNIPRIKVPAPASSKKKWNKIFKWQKILFQSCPSIYHSSHSWREKRGRKSERQRDALHGQGWCMCNLGFIQIGSSESPSSRGKEG